MLESLQGSLQTMLDHIITSAPTLGFALLILVIGWVVARAIGKLTEKLLHRTEFDNVLVENLGMEKLLVDSAGRQRSAENVIGKFVYYFLFLFVIVAFFNTLNIPLVTDPISQMLSKITGAIPNIIEALVILLIAWGIATIARIGVTKLLDGIGVDEKVAKWGFREEGEGEPAKPFSRSIGNLLFYVILLFAIPPFMDALGQTAVSAPLKDMFSKVLGFFPNVISAVIIGLIGWLAARVVRDIVSNLLASAGVDAAGDRMGMGRILGGTRISVVVGTIIYLFILVPAIVAALDALELKALSQPIVVQLTHILGAVPSLILAAVILIAGYVIAQLLRNILVTFLANVGFNNLPASVGLPGLVPREGARTLSEIAGSIFVAVIMLFVAMEAFQAIGLTQLADLTHLFILFLPKVFFALALLGGGLALGNYIKDLLSGMVDRDRPLGGLVPQAARLALIFFAGAMALQQLGIGDQIVTNAFTILFGAVCLAAALAVGLGSKDVVGQYLKDYRESADKNPKA